MSPLRIAISANFLYPDKTRLVYPPKTLVYGEEAMLRWVAKKGAVPFLIPSVFDYLSAKQLLSDCDGLILSGGADLCPKSYGEDTLRPEWEGDFKRDQYEIDLFHCAFDMGLPVLGICRGHQLMNVALGGTLYQDIQTQNQEAKCHRDGAADVYDKLSHHITIEDGSLLSSIYGGATEGFINSIHHQAVKDLGAGLKPQAYAIPDNIIEAIWLDDPAYYALGIQWHPEWITAQNMLDPDLILDHFLTHCSGDRVLAAE